MDLEDCKRKLAQIENANPIQKNIISEKEGAPVSWLTGVSSSEKFYCMSLYITV